MVRPDKKKLEKLKKQDKMLAKLPSMDQEKRRFDKGESLLKRLIKPKRIELDLREMESARKAQLKKNKTGSRQKSAKKR
ncbi:hypothetical protein KY359_01570 [Candidatus Woesearchaeota archaeon]|nr:hypothetical protein [Candidatus Woesearchaeota archaeon]